MAGVVDDGELGFGHAPTELCPGEGGGGPSWSPTAPEAGSPASSGVILARLEVRNSRISFLLFTPGCSECRAAGGRPCSIPWLAVASVP